MARGFFGMFLYGAATVSSFGNTTSQPTMQDMHIPRQAHTSVYINIHKPGDGMKAKSKVTRYKRKVAYRGLCSVYVIQRMHNTNYYSQVTPRLLIHLSWTVLTSLVLAMVWRSAADSDGDKLLHHFSTKAPWPNLKARLLVLVIASQQPISYEINWGVWHKLQTENHDVQVYMVVADPTLSSGSYTVQWR